VTVAVPARLHLGFLDLDGGLGRRFGSIGLPIDGLGTRVAISAADETTVDGPERERAARHLAAMQARLGMQRPVRLTVQETVPAHAGLGSGTQIALAVAAALRTLFGLPLDPAGDALHLGRGRRSGVGVGLFEAGGLVTDGGRATASGVAPVVSRIAFPEQWRVLVVLDPGRQGLSGADESAAFARLPAFSPAEAAALCRLVLMQILPALCERDLASFGAGVSALQQRLGDYYAPVQGGARFASPQIESILNHLQAHGATGIGQSSWGPTGFAFVASAQEAERLAAQARAHGGAEGLDIRVCRALNRGAEISTQTARG
jgi:beta-RFAP synthase